MQTFTRNTGCDTKTFSAPGSQMHEYNKIRVKQGGKNHVLNS